MNKGLTLREIARLAKVSTATVSRAINRIPTVDPVLARRIRKVIEKEGYFPNTNARALVHGRSRSLGLIVSEITNPFFPEIVQTFAKLGAQHNYEILLSSIDHDPRMLEMAARQMIERRVGGVAILTFGDELPLIDALTTRNVPVFVVDADSSGPLLKTVQVDYEHGIRQAVQHLAALGHERIAFVGGPRDLKTATIRRSAVEKCMEEIGLELRPELFVDGDHSIEAGMKALSALAALPDRPSAVLCSNDMTAIGVMRAAFDLRLKVPRDLSVVGFDDIRLAQFMAPPLTTVQMSQTEIAQLSFSALLDFLEPTRHGNGRQMYSMKTNLILRRSTALAPGCLVNRAATAHSEADMVLKLAEKMQSRKDRTRSLEPHRRDMFSVPQLEST
ncbi:MAG: LacI family DNA-binding transcriptional regulator [Candidatus Sulfotelmatobacter sp.]